MRVTWLGPAPVSTAVLVALTLATRLVSWLTGLTASGLDSGRLTGALAASRLAGPTALTAALRVARAAEASAALRTAAPVP